MFYFQQLLNIALSGIDSTSIIATVINIAYGILLVGFLIGIYQAVLRGGDVQALGVTAIKYLVVAIIIANWGTVFREVNASFNSVAQFISNSAGAGDMFLSWMDQLQQQFTNTNISLWDAITGDIAGLIGLVMFVVAYVFYVVAIVFFCFFYSLYGSILYVVGPLVIALLPMAGVGQLAKSFATNLMTWNAWGIIYAIMGALITAIHMNQLSQFQGSGFVGFFAGLLDAWILGLVSVFFALSIALIPFIAKRVISGDVGSTAMSMVQAGLTAGGVVVATAHGFASAGSAAGSGTSSAGSAGSSGGGGGAASGGATSGGGSPGAAASSSAPPAPSNVGESIRAGLASAVNGSSSPSSANSGGGSDASESSVAEPSGSPGGEQSGNRSPNGGGSGPRSGSTKFRPQGLPQTLAYQAARALGKASGRGKKESE